MADHKDRKHYVAPPKGRPVSQDDALAMGYALFDAIAKDQADKARRDADQQDDDQEE